MMYDPAYRRAYYERNREKAAAQSRARYVAQREDPEWYARMLANGRAYHEANRERVSERQRARKALPEVKARLAAYQREARRKAGLRPRAQRPEYDCLSAARNANNRARRLGMDGRITTAEVRQVMDAGSCAACRSEGRPTLDHIVPLSRGGPNVVANLRRLCLSCNSSKRDKTPSEVPS